MHFEWFTGTVAGTSHFQLFDMARFQDAISLELTVFLYAMAAAVFSQLLTGGIRTSGLLARKDGSGALSSTRVQLLITTIAAAGYYLSKVAANTSNTMPDIDPQWLYGFGGSAGLYALRKAWIGRSKFKRILGG